MSTFTNYFARAGPLTALAFAAALVFAPSPLVKSATPIGVAIMANTPRPAKPKHAAADEHRSKLGPIPLDNFGNDIPVGRPVDKSDGSLYDRTKKWIAEHKK